MRPVRITGITGNSQWVPVDAYSPFACSVDITGATSDVEATLENVFDPNVINPQVIGPLFDGALGYAPIPAGARAVRGISMAPGDVMVVSQQGIA